LYSRN